MLGGTDTNKEELHHWGTEFARRGFAVLSVDGPGQGELAARYERLMMRFDTYHEAISTILDWVEQNAAGVDTGRIGIFGNSLGGYLALDAALRDSRIKAAISNGGFCDAASLDQWPAGVVRAFASCLGIEEAEAIRAHLTSHLDLSSVEATQKKPPSLVIHGGREDLADVDESRRAAQVMEGTLLVVKDGWHTCTNRDHLISPVLADWLSTALAKPTRPGFNVVQIEDEHGYRALFDITEI